MKRTTLLICLVIAAAMLASPRPAAARVRLENICSIYGQKEIHLTGVGLVVGLNGTGDGGKDIHAMRALASALRLLNTPVLSLAELKDADNVAIVLIEARIPKTGIRRGQKIDCYVSSFKGAKSLRGGRLLASPLKTTEIDNNVAVGIASGALTIEGDSPATSAKIAGGVVLEDSFPSMFVDKERGYIVTLLLDENHAGFRTASEVAHVVNEEFQYETSAERIARAAGPHMVEVQIPEHYRESPVEFVAQLLGVGIDDPNTQARVVVNTKTNTVIVTGEVEISPAIITHPNLTVEVGGTRGGDLFGGGGGSGGTFVPVPAPPEDSAQPQHLSELVQALDQLRVPKSDIVSILRELNRSGKLHAEYIEY